MEFGRDLRGKNPYSRFGPQSEENPHSGEMMRIQAYNETA